MVTMNRNKVVVVGAGTVGSTVAFGLVSHGLCNEVVLIDPNRTRAMGESHDLDDGSEFFDRHVNVHVGDYADCANADIVVVTAGRRPAAGVEPAAGARVHRRHRRTDRGRPSWPPGSTACS